MRCPDCNKFVSYDDGAEPEVNDLEVSKDGQVSGTVRVVLPCGECSTELKEANFDIDLNVELPKNHVCHIPAVVGCPKHKVGKACAVCGWDGVPKLVSGYPTKITHYSPPKSFGGETKFIGAIGHTFFEIGEEEKFAKQVAEVEAHNRGIPAEIRAQSARTEEPEYEVDADATLASRADCGKDKKGRPRKFNPRYATTYYGYDLTGTVHCGCGKVLVEFFAADEIEASAMDELT